MSTSTRCPHCIQPVEIDSAMVEKEVVCPSCRQEFTIHHSSEATVETSIPNYLALAVLLTIFCGRSALLLLSMPLARTDTFRLAVSKRRSVHRTMPGCGVGLASPPAWLRCLLSWRTTCGTSSCCCRICITRRSEPSCRRPDVGLCSEAAWLVLEAHVACRGLRNTSLWPV
jgi:hypothetical protein